MFAQFTIGTFLHSQEKFEEAIRFFALTADQGLTEGEFNLGIFCRDGVGMEVDLGKARYWFERAAAKGDEPAIEALAELDA